MSIFFNSYKYKTIKLTDLDTFISASYSLPQQEIIPIGKVYLHYLYRELKTIPYEKTILTGHFIIYQHLKPDSGKGSIIICIYDESLKVGQERIFKFKILNGDRLLKHKTIKYYTDHISAKKLDHYNGTKHTLVAHGNFELDNRTQYNLYGYGLEKKPFHMTFITSKSNQYFTRYTVESASVE